MIRFITIIMFFGLFIMCNSKSYKEGNLVEVDSSDEFITCPDDSNWGYEEIEIALRNRFDKYQWMSRIYLDDTLGVTRVNFHIKYEYVHRSWDGKILTVEIMRYLSFLEDICEAKMPNRENFLVSINYNFEGLNSAMYFVKIPLQEFAYYELPLYKEFVDYILLNMTPSDFQAYDRALEVLFDKKKDSRLNIDFYGFLVGLSEDIELSKDEEFVMNELMKWARGKSKTETTEHFEYFKSLIEVENPMNERCSS